MSGGLLTVDFCGEVHELDGSQPFMIGREADLSVDDNPYLHRQFLELARSDGLWWLSNVGSGISATVVDAAGGTQSWLPPGNRLPVVFAVTTVVFTAGPTTYELSLTLESALYRDVALSQPVMGDTTLGPVALTVSQRRLIVALAEPLLRRDGTSLAAIPASSAAAERLGWVITRFNRKLDNVCDKLDKAGVQGLRGGPGSLATNRRARLVEFAVSTRLVTARDLPLLDIHDAPRDDS